MNVFAGGGVDLEVSHRENCFSPQAAASAKTIFVYFFYFIYFFYCMARHGCGWITQRNISSENERKKKK